MRIWGFNDFFPLHWFHEFRAEPAHSSFDDRCEEPFCRFKQKVTHTTCPMQAFNSYNRFFLLGVITPALKSVGQGSPTLLETSFECVISCHADFHPVVSMTNKEYSTRCGQNTNYVFDKEIAGDGSNDINGDRFDINDNSTRETRRIRPATTNELGWQEKGI